ncbi:hypothetical protein M2126_001332 [Polynucleobacter sphagniphilus]|uniref:Uncharacterized protein n=1 Tax=Polynucleobacter sphagniphilus TaxID=1743169 RepID=A0AA43M9L2_9BURK|nr:hypothetical protein [Polynucleobacter sphagniphilus]MDH6512697.1 hypothetical protein [Polynucleobacter sphagniphilus]
MCETTPILVVFDPNKSVTQSHLYTHDRLCTNGAAQITDKKKPTAFLQWVLIYNFFSKFITDLSQR